MTLFSLPFRHTLAKWPRSLLLCLVFMLGLASMTGLRLVSVNIMGNFEKKLLSFGANILITPRQEVLKIGYGGYSLGDVAVDESPLLLEESLRAMDGIELRENIAVIAPKLLAVGRLSGRPVTLVGIDPEQEFQLKAYWEFAGETPQAGDELLVVAGASAAATLSLQAGSPLALEAGSGFPLQAGSASALDSPPTSLPGRLLDEQTKGLSHDSSSGHTGGHTGGQQGSQTDGQSFGRALTVSAVLAPTGGDDDNVLFVPLPVAQALAGKPGQVSLFEVAALCSGCPIEDIVAQLQAALPGAEVRALAQVAESRMYAVHFAHHLALFVSTVILITACAMLVMSMLSSVAERKREIGILRAVGYARSRVFAMFVAEALAIGILAGAGGYAMGIAVAVRVLEALDLPSSPGALFDAGWLGLAMLGAAATAALAAAFPAWRASRIEPAEALVSL